MFGKSPFSSAPISSLLNQAYAKALSIVVSTTLNFAKNINKIFSVIAEYVIVVLSDLAFHLIGFSIHVVGSVSLKRAIAQTLTILSTSIATVVKGVAKSLKAVVNSIVVLFTSISKLLTASVTTIVSLFKFKTIVKVLTASVTTIVSYIRSVLKTLLIVSTPVIIYARFLTKIILLNVSAYLQLVPEFVKRFGAVATFTFVVQPRDRLISVAHQTILVVQKAERLLSIIKSRIILIFKGGRNG